MERFGDKNPQLHKARETLYPILRATYERQKMELYKREAYNILIIKHLKSNNLSGSSPIGFCFYSREVSNVFLE